MVKNTATTAAVMAGNTVKVNSAGCRGLFITFERLVPALPMLERQLSGVSDYVLKSNLRCVWSKPKLARNLFSK